MADEYDYDDVDDFYDNNHVNNNSNNYNDAADDSEGESNVPISKTRKKNSPNRCTNFDFGNSFADTEEASESEYGRTGRNHDEPLEIKEQWVIWSLVVHTISFASSD